MGDVTQFHLRIDGGSENVRRRLVEVYAEYVYGSFGDDAAPDKHETIADDWFEGSCGSSDEMLGQFATIIRNTKGPNRPTYVALTEDGKYEWSGTLMRWKPRIGWHVASIDNAGNVIVTTSELLHLIDKAASLDTLRKRVEKTVGKAWDLNENPTLTPNIP